MVKKIRKVSDEKMKQLQGFEEVMDLVLDEQERIESMSRKKENDRLNESFQSLSFLEDEFERLNKIDRFFSLKQTNKIKNDQTPQLIDQQNILSVQLRNKILNNAQERFSAVNENITNLFRHAFSGSKKEE